jgi:hypothetical protein
MAAVYKYPKKKLVLLVTTRTLLKYSFNVIIYKVSLKEWPRTALGILVDLSSQAYPVLFCNNNVIKLIYNFLWEANFVVPDNSIDLEDFPVLCKSMSIKN